MEAFENWAKRCAARGDIHCVRTLQRTGYDIRPRCREASVLGLAIANGHPRLVEEHVHSHARREGLQRIARRRSPTSRRA